jgi:uncharacterized membrane protein YgdD (TMEM256/DUF423 family)
MMLGSVFTFAAAVFASVFGLIYLVRPKFMGYHQKAVQRNWNELVPEIQTLILALMRATSAGFLSVAIAIVILQIEYNIYHQRWIAWTMLIIGTVLASGSFYAMFLVRTRTPGRPPIIPVFIILILLLTGFFFNIL